MLVSGYQRSWAVGNVAELDAALAWRDERGGAVFWLTGEARYPALAIRATGVVADVHYFPEDGHPGFRCLCGEGLPEGGDTLLVFAGCDPSLGESTPNEFVVPFTTARYIAQQFLLHGRMSDDARWFEL